RDLRALLRRVICRVGKGPMGRHSVGPGEDVKRAADRPMLLNAVRSGDAQVAESALGADSIVYRNQDVAEQDGIGRGQREVPAGVVGEAQTERRWEAPAQATHG